MPYTLTDEQSALQSSLRGFFTERLTTEYLKTRFEGQVSTDPDLWSQINDLGLLSYFASVDPSESPGKFADLGVISRESGRSLIPENLVDVILAGPFMFGCLLGKNGRKDLLAKLPPGLAANFGAGLEQGTVRICLAPPGVASVKIEASQDKTAVIGNFRFVPGADQAKWLLTQIADQLWLIDLSSGARCDAEPALDRVQRSFSVSCTGSPAIKVPEVEAQRFTNLVYALRASEMAALCERVTEMTAEYVKTRKQFDVPIGGFQAVQHRLADMHVDSESLGALAQFAIWAAEKSPDQLSLAAQAAISQACLVAPRVVEAGIQLHGGVGFTWEYHLHLFLRRAKSVAAIYQANRAAEILAAVG